MPIRKAGFGQPRRKIQTFTYNSMACASSALQGNSRSVCATRSEPEPSSTGRSQAASHGTPPVNDAIMVGMAGTLRDCMQGMSKTSPTPVKREDMASARQVFGLPDSSRLRENLLPACHFIFCPATDGDRASAIPSLAAVRAVRQMFPLRDRCYLHRLLMANQSEVDGAVVEAVEHLQKLQFAVQFKRFVDTAFLINK